MSSPAKEPPWKERRRIPDPQVRDAADQFDNARLLLHAQPPGSGTLLALINNAAVALELYLKSLGAVTVHTPVPDFPGLSIVTSKAKVKGHGLIGLLERVPDGVRQPMDQAYATAHAGASMRDALKKYGGLFEASRYAFEERKNIDKYSLDGLIGLCSFLRHFTSSMTRIDCIK